MDGINLNNQSLKIGVDIMNRFCNSCMYYDGKDQCLHKLKRDINKLGICLQYEPIWEDI